MKVYVIKTEEFELSKFKEVKDFLDTFEGSIEFHFSDYNNFTTEEFPFLVKADNAKEIDVCYDKWVEDDWEFEWYIRKMRVSSTERKLYQCLTFDEIFSLCDYYRNNLKIGKEDFVVILTKWNNEYNFFSSYNSKRNIFVNGNNWEKFAGQANSKYPIAYEITQNILSTLMKIEFDPHKFIDVCAKVYKDAAHYGKYKTTHYSDYIHESPRGCINDLCRRKEEIINKLRAATICPNCAVKIANEKIDAELLSQLFSILSAIRGEFIIKFDKPKKEIKAEPYPLEIDEKKRIWILTEKEKVELRLRAQYKMLYIFLLRHEDGCEVKKITDYKAELLQIYLEIPAVKKGKDDAEKVMKSLIEATGFNSAVSKINGIISDLLPDDSLADFYKIQGEKLKPYKIKISRKLVNTLL